MNQPIGLLSSTLFAASAARFGGILLAFSIVPGLAVAQDLSAGPQWREYAEGFYSYELAGENSIVLVSEGGVLIVDTYNTAHAQALKQEIEERLDLPVQYVIYSHAHADHVRGADVFSDTATFIAQARQVPRLEFLAEYEKSIVLPDLTFDEEFRINYGGREIIFRDYGPNHATGVTVMYSPQDRVVAVFDIVYPQRFLWFALNDYSPRAMLATLKAVYELDFETNISAHGRPATRAEFREFIGFMDDLISQVAAIIDRHGATEGPFATLQIALEEVDLSDYQTWGFYNEWRDRNIEGVFQSLFVGF